MIIRNVDLIECPLNILQVEENIPELKKQSPSYQQTLKLNSNIKKLMFLKSENLKKYYRENDKFIETLSPPPVSES